MSEVGDEARFRFLVEHAPDGVVILVAGRIVFINPVAIRLLGADPDRVLGTSILEYLPPEDARLTMERIGQMMRTGQDLPPNEYRVKADPKRVVEIKSTPCMWGTDRAVIAYARDVSERKAMQEKLVAADRFAALGKLAASVAHEINNPLTYAHANLEMIELRLHGLGIATLDPMITDAKHGLDRIATVTKDLRVFARTDTTPAGPVDLVAAIEQSLRMVDNELRHRAKCTRRFATNLPMVHGSSARLEQVFVNLFINAIHALGNPATDEIAIELEADDAHVVARVIDSGCGIPDDTLDKIFEPFYTTKPSGLGMGLGLAVCKNLVESDGGSIRIASGPTGTTVTVELPRAAEAAKPLEPSAEVPAAGRRRVLIVDDEPFIRDTLCVLLSAYHEVVSADGGAAALAALATDRFDVIISDVMMPGMNGLELYRRIAREHAGVERSVIFVTGGMYAPDLVAFLEETRSKCLAKPFKLEQLLGAIDEIRSP